MQRALAVICAAVIIASSVGLAATYGGMAASSTYDPPPILADGFPEPVLALELARSTGDVGEILRVPRSQLNRKVLDGQIEKDWFLIVAYVGFFAALASPQFNSNDRVRRGLG